MEADDIRFIRISIDAAREAREKGNHPFGAILVGPGGEVLLAAENTVVTGKDATGHAETNLVREATKVYTAEFLERCTMYASTEPCPMCAGAIFWSNIRRVVYGLGEDRLYQIIGANPDAVILSLPCREVFARGGHEVEVFGPVIEGEAEIVHDGFW